MFDRLVNQYLEPRKASSGNDAVPRTAAGVTTRCRRVSKAAAAEQYERCASGLNQINVFEDQLATLAR